MKEHIKQLIKSNSFFMNLLLKLKNKYYGDGIDLKGFLVRNNNIRVSGKNNCLSNGNNCSIQNNRINIQGNDNKIALGHDTSCSGSINDSSVLIFGNNNRIEIDDNFKFESLQIFIRGNNNHLHIHKNCSGVFVQMHFEYEDNELIIGEHTTMHGREERSIHIAMDERTTIHIGEDCMLSNNIQIRSSDSHSIVDFENKRLNYAQDIYIGNHCWLGLNSMILKGAYIPDNTVVAAGSICTKKYYDKNTILAGIPAKVAKCDINWDRERL